MPSSQPPIDKLGPDLLLMIFDVIAQDDYASLTSAVRCSRAWQPLAQSAMYGDVFLNQPRLAKFVDRCADTQIRSLTVTMRAIGVPGAPSEANKIADARLASLGRLCARIRQMRPTTVSISVDLPFPRTAAREVAHIVESLSPSCTSLEIKLSYGSLLFPPADFSSSPHHRPHLCESIRTVLPQLRHLRLCLPVLCPALFSTISPAGQGQNQHRQAVSAPLLQSCVINLAQRTPSYPQGAWTTPCSDNPDQVPHGGQEQQLPSALPPMVEALEHFASLNSGNLETFSVMDVQPRDPTVPNSYAGWTRRDFLSRSSFPIPVFTVGGLISVMFYVARTPSPKKEGETEDWATPSSGQLEMIAEGGTWLETKSGTHLPVQKMLKQHRVVDAALTRAQYMQRPDSVRCQLWYTEDDTGERVLPTRPGELMRRWELQEMCPPGWIRAGRHGPMVRA
ncbi:Uu.00g117580.m01.CDS01 [Anthostomella pinea]|uniref:Uu.00g117580.m01.CDS01 n=1 Tax=Anthostomella pinea TaxID=933095 RepID=A0AAI8YGY0_9PEZI|nr:Uu.00g117580.m01.CDS01 [Anthostomella pinea]